MGSVFLMRLLGQGGWNDILTGKVCIQDVGRAMILFLFSLAPAS
jgi:hypothetical protein